MKIFPGSRKPVFTLFFWSQALIFLGAALALPETVQVNYDGRRPTRGIQEAVDSLSGRGGTVVIPAGHYILRSPIFLTERHSNLIIAGEGEATALETEADEYLLRLAEDARKGSHHIVVTGPGPVRVGDGLYIYEDGNDYGIGTVTRVVSINGRLISVDPELLDSYRVRNQAVARHIFNVFCANGVSNLTIRNLQVIGSLKKSPTISSWVGNSLFFLDGQNITVSQVSVEDAPADGIYIGAHDGVRVSQCRLKNIAQRAIHLAGHRGSGRMRGAIEGNTISYAGDYGVYFCDNCRGLIVKGNIISDIGVYQGAGGTIRTQEAAPVDARRFRFLRQLLPAYTRPAGIGGIGAGGDADNIIAENIIYRVKGTGIAFQRWTTENRPGRNMTVAGNVIFDIFGPGIFLYGANGVLVSGNNISSSQTGVVVKKSIFCQLQGNLIRTARTGIQIYSLMPDLWTEKNVIVNNTLVDCQSSIVQNYFCRNNLIRDNYNFQSQ